MINPFFVNKGPKEIEYIREPVANDPQEEEQCGCGDKYPQQQDNNNIM